MYFLDSCICIDFLRGRLDAGRELMRESDPRLFGVPSMVEAELFLGAAKSRRPEENRLLVERFLLPFESVPFDAACAREYAFVRARLEAEGMSIGPADMVIASCALVHHAVLVTHNTREFARVSGLVLEDWADVGL